MSVIYVIAWYYYDHSGSGVVDYAFNSKDEAERICKMLQEHGTRQYILHTLELLGGNLGNR